MFENLQNWSKKYGKFINLIKKHCLNTWLSTDEALIKKHDPLLFFKHHENEYPVLSLISKAIFSLMSASTSIECSFSSCAKLGDLERIWTGWWRDGHCHGKKTLTPLYSFKRKPRHALPMKLLPDPKFFSREIVNPGKKLREIPDPKIFIPGFKFRNSGFLETFFPGNRLPKPEIFYPGN